MVPVPCAGADLLEDYAEIVLATDAHNLGRCSGLSAGYRWVHDHLGPQRVTELRSRSDKVLTAVSGASSKDSDT